MFEMKSPNGLQHGETAIYEITMDKPYTVREFIVEAIAERPKEWGSFRVGPAEQDYFDAPYCKYKYGKLSGGYGNIPEDILDTPVLSASARGGWSAMDYRLVTAGATTGVTEISKWDDAKELEKLEKMTAEPGSEAEPEPKPKRDPDSDKSPSIEDALSCAEKYLLKSGLISSRLIGHNIACAMAMTMIDDYGCSKGNLGTFADDAYNAVRGKAEKYCGELLIKLIENGANPKSAISGIILDKAWVMKAMRQLDAKAIDRILGIMYDEGILILESRPPCD